MALPGTLRFSFRPRLLDSLKGYGRADFAADAGAGLTVGLVALPLAMAFGIASGVRPEQGIAAAIVGGILVGLLGGSRVQVAGPAGAFVALLYGIAQKHGVANLLIATMMAGVLLFAMGACRLGSLVRFVPVAIVVGFTSGIAVVIALSQVRDFLGIAVDSMPSNFLSQVGVLGANLHSANPLAMAIGASCLGVIALWPMAHREARGTWRFVVAKLPSTVVVLGLSGLAVWALALPVETIASRFGGLPEGLPSPTLPRFDWSSAQNLFGPTVAIALLGAIESLLCARIADTMTADRHDPNQELMAQGIANVASPLFGGIAVTGTIARTMTNVRSGARTPVAAIVHGFVLFAVVLVLAPAAGHIPLAALAAVLLWVAFNMFGWRELRELPRYSVAYRVVLLTTLALTVVFDLTVAVEAGLVLASLVFIFRISSLTRIEPAPLADGGALAGGRRVAAWRIYGSLFFGSVNKLEQLMERSERPPHVVILDLHHVIYLDTTGLDALRALHASLAARGARLLLADLDAQPREMVTRTGFAADLGGAAIFSSIDAAHAAAKEFDP